MALTSIQALDVVIGCVNGVSGRTPSPTDTLKKGGITDAPRLQAWKSLVVSDPVRGIRKHGHSLAPATLNGVGVDDTVQAAANTARANAVPVAAFVAMSGGFSISAPVGLTDSDRPKAKRKMASSTKSKTKKASGKSKASGKVSKKTPKKSAREKAGKARKGGR